MELHSNVSTGARAIIGDSEWVRPPSSIGATTSPAPSDIFKGVLAGVIGGLAGSWAMTQFHVALYGRGVTNTREPQSHRPVDGRDDATTKAGDVIAQATTNRRLTRQQKRFAGPAVHYMFGAAMGGMYGALREIWPQARRANGMAFGLAVWAGADEGILPLLGLSKGPQAYPLSRHVEMLAAHLVYGYTTEEVTDRVRRQPR